MQIITSKYKINAVKRVLTQSQNTETTITIKQSNKYILDSNDDKNKFYNYVDNDNINNNITIIITIIKKNKNKIIITKIHID